MPDLEHRQHQAGFLWMNRVPQKTCQYSVGQGAFSRQNMQQPDQYDAEIN